MAHQAGEVRHRGIGERTDLAEGLDGVLDDEIHPALEWIAQDLAQGRDDRPRLVVSTELTQGVQRRTLQLPPVSGLIGEVLVRDQGDQLGHGPDRLGFHLEQAGDGHVSGRIVMALVGIVKGLDHGVNRELFAMQGTNPPDLRAEGPRPDGAYDDVAPVLGKPGDQLIDGLPTPPFAPAAQQGSDQENEEEQTSHAVERKASPHDLLACEVSPFRACAIGLHPGR